MGALIEKLKQNGNLVLFRDYRSGSLWDWSGNENHGTGSNAHFRRGLGGYNLHFNDPNGYEVVSDTPLLRLVDCSLITFGEFNKPERNGTVSRLISKRDAGGINYDLRVDDTPQIQIYDGVSTRSLNVDYIGSKYIGTSIESGEIPKGFLNGLFAGDFSGIVTLTEDDADLYLGNWYSQTTSVYNPLIGHVITNIPLTEDEHAQLYSEVME